MNVRNVRCSKPLLWVATLALTLIGFQAAALTEGGSASNPADHSVTAQWQDYDLNFHYFGFTSYYTCSGIESKLEELLRELGADPKVRVSATGCFGSNDIGKSISARIKVRMPIQQTAVAPSVDGASFKATSKSVVLRSGRGGDYGSTDCELLEQVRDQLLPALKMKLVKDDLRCIPGQPSLGSRGIEVMALLPEAKAK